MSGRRAKRERREAREPLFLPAKMTPWLHRAIGIFRKNDSHEWRARMTDPGLSAVVWFYAFFPGLLVAAGANFAIEACGVPELAARRVGLAVLLIPPAMALVCLLRALMGRDEDYVRWPDEVLGAVLGATVGALSL